MACWNHAMQRRQQEAKNAEAGEMALPMESKSRDNPAVHIASTLWPSTDLVSVVEMRVGERCFVGAFLMRPRRHERVLLHEL